MPHEINQKKKGYDEGTVSSILSATETIKG